MLAEGRKPNITAVSKRHKIPYWTLYRRFLGQNMNASQAQEKKKKLPQEVEEVFVQW
jgi:hypothetical protein